MTANERSEKKELSDRLSKSIHSDSGISLLSIPEDSLFSSKRDDRSVDSTDSPIPRIDPSRRRNQSGTQVTLLDSIPSTTLLRSYSTDDDIETGSQSGSQRSRSSRLSIKEQKRGLDEAFMMYTRAEKAALMIQKKFRDRHTEFANDMEHENDHHDTSHTLENDELEKEGPDTAGMLTTLVIALTAVVPMVWGWISKCISMLGRGPDAGVDDAGVRVASEGVVANGGGGAPGAGGGGGGGAQPNP